LNFHCSQSIWQRLIALETGLLLLLMTFASQAGVVAHYRIHAAIDPVLQQMRVHVQISGLATDVKPLLLDHRFTVITGKNENHAVNGSLPLKVEHGKLVLDYRVPLHLQGGNILWLDAPWYPYRDGLLMTMDSTFEVPAGWRVLSQGQALEQKTRGLRWIWRWREEQPQQALFLLAGPYHEEARSGPGYQMSVWLLQADPVLAKVYLDAAARYLALYSHLLGTYPYKKFVLVENSRPTGFGLPSFTLIGHRIIRLPFIVYTSFPHEILHNWFGNGVYVNDTGGNWSEGLTTYLADYAMAEARGKGTSFRRNQLQKFTDFVNQSVDSPLRSFHSRHNESSAAVGYSKSMMFFHMLRKHLGATQFLQGLRKFYHQYQFRRASFGDLLISLEQVSGVPLRDEYRQWLDEPGAPLLRLNAAACKAVAGGHQISGMMEQRQTGRLYHLSVPVWVEFVDGTIARYRQSLRTARRGFSRHFTKAVRRFALDPGFDLFRRLDSSEVPPSFGQYFGSRDLQLVLPTRAPAEEYQAWRVLAKNWQQRYPDISIIDDSADSTVGKRILLGRENRLLQPKWQKFQKKRWQSLRLSTGLACKGLAADGQAWLRCRSPQAIAALARKLVHYSRYSYLALGLNLQVLAKGQWPVSSATMQHWCSQVPALTPSWEVLDHSLLAW